MNPVMSYGGNVCCTGNGRQGWCLFDQQPDGAKRRYIVYTTAPLKDGLLEVSGFYKRSSFVS